MPCNHVITHVEDAQEPCSPTQLGYGCRGKLRTSPLVFGLLQHMSPRAVVIYDKALRRVQGRLSRRELTDA